MRLYPQPPVYTRRAVVEDVLPKGLGVVPAGQDLLVSIYNLHRSPANWGPNSQSFEPMRFGPLAFGQPNELNTGYRYTPFSAGPRRCPGDKFAVLEGMAIWAVLFRRVEMRLVEGHDVVMTSGATIHTRDGMLVNASKREMKKSVSESDLVDWANLTPTKDIGQGWFEKGIESKTGGGKCPMPFVE
jgi:carotene epsilon-monooxygenase